MPSHLGKYTVIVKNCILVHGKSHTLQVQMMPSPEQASYLLENNNSEI
jgi:hypothetical protein